MLYAVWSSFGEAELNVDLEANAVADIYRLADALRGPQRTELQTLARSYVDAVIHQEWPEMARVEVPEKSTAINAEMPKAIVSVKAALPATELSRRCRGFLAAPWQPACALSTHSEVKLLAPLRSRGIVVFVHALRPLTNINPFLDLKLHVWNMHSAL